MEKILVTGNDTKKRSRKLIVAEEKALKSFDNACNLAESTTTNFLAGAVENIIKVDLTVDGQKHVRNKAEQVKIRLKENKKTVLPDEWELLLHLGEQK